MTPNAGTLAFLSRIRTERKPEVLEHPYHEMLQALQTTLDLEELLEIFSIHLRPVVRHEAYRYRSGDTEWELQAGKPVRHSCRYNLMLEEESLGEWQLFRSRRFTETELATIEAYLCRLLYPLRNALRYRRALQSAYVDPLTNTRNRSALFGSFQREWELARRQGAPLSVIMIDIDHFKSINDNHGHEVGDMALCAVARCLKESVRASDIVFRYGGEEFVVLLSNTDLNGASQLAERIRLGLQGCSLRIGGDLALTVTASLGVAAMRADETPHGLLKRADDAMYAAKHQGRNRVMVSE